MNTESKKRPQGYKYISSCGRGTYGEAWYVYELPSEKPLVLKLIYKTPENENWRTELEGVKTYCQVVSQMSERERRTLVNILHTGETEEYFYYTMDPADNLAIDGSFIPKTLATEMKEHRLTLMEMLAISLRLLDALIALRNHHIVHRDIKPENILFFNGLPRLGDVGLMATQSSSIDLLGTPGFLPPELLERGSLSLPINEGEWDVYAFGKLMYVMDTGLSVDNFPDYSLADDASRHNRHFAKLWTAIAASKRADRLTDLNVIHRKLLAIQKNVKLQSQIRSPFLNYSFLVILGLLVALCVILYRHYTAPVVYDNLFAAICANDLQGVSARLELGESPNAPNGEGTLPLIYALSIPNVNPRIVMRLLAAGAFTDKVGKISPLEMAIANKLPFDIIRQLLLVTSRIQEIEVTNGGNLLHTAVTAHDKQTAERLLEKLRPYTVDNQGRTALMTAMFTQQYEMVELLLQHKARLDIKDKYGLTLLHFLQPGSLEVAERLLKEMPPNVQAHNGATPLLLATLRKVEPALLELLLKHGASPQIADKDGLTPVAAAIAMGDVYTARLLAQHGADLNTRDQQGFSYLHYAVLYHRYSCAQWLIKRNPLHTAINVQDNSGKSPLHWACLLQDSEMEKLLLENGANSRLTDRNGLTPEQLKQIASLEAFEEGSPCHKWQGLMRHCSIRKEPMKAEEKAALRDLLSDKTLNFEAPANALKIYQLLANEPDISPRDTTEPDFVNLAVKTNNITVLTKVLASEPDLNLPDEEGNTPVLLAASLGNVQMLELFCYKDADITHRNRKGEDLVALAKSTHHENLLYFAGISLPQFLLKDEGTPKWGEAHLSYEAVRKRDSIYTAQDFLRVKCLHKNASAVHCALKTLEISPNVELSVSQYVIHDDAMTYYTQKELLQYGALVNLRNTEGRTPLHLAILNGRPLYYIKQLLDYGASPRIRDDAGNSALDLAKERNLLLLVKLLEFY